LINKKTEYFQDRGDEKFVCSTDGELKFPKELSMEKCISIITGTHLQHDLQKTKQCFTLGINKHV